ncbi:hypothetical protein OPV22_022618 [Ensete ventricosum]|uniref:Uncharacterized protein n=1 Tax=Ensete ventricosum TaxID=4639 RepID=A0AAV8PEB2_ENSVE|nr:hypothetical protein OPV22_022618 [Ensete ventricosum]
MYNWGEEGGGAAVIFEVPPTTLTVAGVRCVPYDTVKSNHHHLHALHAKPVLSCGGGEEGGDRSVCGVGGKSESECMHLDPLQTAGRKGGKKQTDVKRLNVVYGAVIAEPTAERGTSSGKTPARTHVLSFCLEKF